MKLLNWGIGIATVLSLIAAMALLGTKAFASAAGLGSGALLSLLNYWTWTKIAAQLLGGQKLGFGLVLFLVKLAVNGAVIFALISLAHVGPIAFLAGVGIGILGLIVGGFFSNAPTASSTEGIVS